jgi:Mn2+/Fe2+ NRAMP family transporter
LLIIAIVGTTVAPWQLFFQQSNIVDKRITPRWIGYERVDTVVGSFVTVAGAAAIMITCAFAFGGSADFGGFHDAGKTAAALAAHLGSAAGAMYAVVLLNASLIGASAVTLATSYALGDTIGVRHSLHWSVGEAKGFYAIFSGMIALAAAIVLIPAAPLGLITTAVQALAGVLLPSASVFLLLLCNDRGVLGPWVNASWLNAVAIVIISALLMLSGILMATTLFPAIDTTVLLLVLGGLLTAALLVSGIAWLVRRRPQPVERERRRRDREEWTMPPLALLDRPAWSPMRTFAVGALWVYLVVAILLLLLKSVELAIGR